MRNRFFLIILAVLFVVTASAIVIHSLFLRQERLSLIDQQVRETASALVDSQLGDLRKINFEEADDIISEELGESRIGKFFVIRNGHGDKIFESNGATVLPITDIPRDKQWVTINTKGKFIRVLNLQLPRISDRTLQVGLVLDKNLVTPNYFSLSSLVFVAVVLALGLVASLILTTFLLKPIAKLEQFLTNVSDLSRSKSQLPAVPENILSRSRSKPRDEFNRMVASLNMLIEKVNRNYRFSRIWAYQMAHELKTPLALLNMEIEKIQRKANLTAEEMAAANGEVTKISETIESFLSWAELENSSQQKHLFINRLGSLMESLCERFESAHPHRLKLNVQAHPTVVSSPQHLEQLLLNLISNALSYSSVEPVTVEVLEDSIVISDQGQGIPKDVLDRIGEPFNRGDSAPKIKGHGLGLAWVKSVCRLYSWDLDINSTNHGTSVAIRFPKTIERGQELSV